MTRWLRRRGWMYGAMAIVASSGRFGTVIDKACAVSAVAIAPMMTPAASQA